MPTVPTTEEPTITLPGELADLVRAEAAARNYASPVEYLRHVVYIDIADASLPPIEQEELEGWLKAEVPKLCAEADAHPELMLTAEDMYQAIDDEIEAIRREQ